MSLIRRLPCVLFLGLAALAQTTLAAAPLPFVQDERSAPTELFDVVRVVDGDTIYVQRNGEREKLRLLSVDTEEKLAGNQSLGPNKPETVFGEECALWAQEFFAARASEDGPARVGLAFPGGLEKRDIYGRLLCHVILDDGTDFNLLLVQKGKSPYFNKYGNSLICHEAFVAAQAAAREAKLGIWNPATNAAATAGTPDARRPYDRLLPWWQVRADAIDGFRSRQAEHPESVIDAEDPEALAGALARGKVVHVFGQPYRLFDESNGDQTILFRSPDRERPLRVHVPASLKPQLAEHELELMTEEFRQNHAWVTGTLIETDRGFGIVLEDAAQWQLAGPQPRLPEPATAR